MKAANLFRLDGLTALVTGASSGLGVTFAEALASAGANVVLAARRIEKLREVEAALQQSGVGVLSVQCDVTDDAQVEAAVSAAWERFGRIDILVNNAGQANDAAAVAECLPNELFDQIIRVNLNGTWYCSRAVARRMLADGQGGSIINIASILGISGASDFPPAYQASKAAVINLTRNMAVNWGDRGVRVNAIAPGWFPSEMTEGVLGHPDFLAWASATAAMKRIGNPDELIGPLLFLASPASSYVTGHTLVVDGGTAAGIGVSNVPQSFQDLRAQMSPEGMGKKIGVAKSVGSAAAD